MEAAFLAMLLQRSRTRVSAERPRRMECVSCGAGCFNGAALV